jgi:hypothetical protein
MNDHHEPVSGTYKQRTPPIESMQAQYGLDTPGGVVLSRLSP